ncbi:MAG TPA: hypothetical protein VFH30_02385 [Acidimicrobiales bacterium]|nr:hypothetical protein [Acidimicrobiales bacterium]
MSERGTGVTAVGMLVGTAVFVGGDAWLSRDESTETMRRSRHAGAAVLGGTLPAHARPNTRRHRQAVAAGGVLAVVSIAIIPYAFR